MKPSSFRYFAPASIDEALALLAEYGEEGNVLAGGQSLVPAMNFRLARPDVLIDINRIAALDYLEERDGQLHIGALARHCRFEQPVAQGALGTLLPRVARHIAHLPIRIRGTFAGSLAHADPASEWCLMAMTLDADLVAASRRGTRVLRPGEFFVGALMTALEPDELLTEIRLPVLDSRWRSGFAEFSRRAGDYALAMCAVCLHRGWSHRRGARRDRGAADRPQRIAAARPSSAAPARAISGARRADSRVRRSTRSRMCRRAPNTDATWWAQWLSARWRRLSAHELGRPAPAAL
jgi:carbon-monoxide dehydrogenase medium subunit